MANAFKLASEAGRYQHNAAAVVNARAPLQLLPTDVSDPVLQALPAAVILLDQRGVVYQANPAAVFMLGEPLVGQPWLTLIKRCFRPRSDDGMEVSLKDGRRVKLEISALLSKTAYTQPGQLIMLTDLTQTRQLQNRLSHLQRLSALGKMMASLAHQIRTPLSSAMLYAQNLAGSTLNPLQQQQFVHKLQSRLQDLEQQLNDMLLFARPDNAQAVCVFSSQQLAADISQAADAQVNAANVSFTITADAEPALLLGNQSALCGAVTNLIQNSIQAGAANIALAITASADEASTVLISLTDDGPGVPASLQHNVFEPFVTGRANGTGLGLAVVQAVAASHHGEVQYSAGKDGGACFSLRLPRHQGGPVTAVKEGGLV
ncbi:MAG: PAS domain-containing sensor histidine kinase [Gammaproteobacteria bacterium]|nr:PAS domain-containing sensor histidine kinase [Gammaproteobacteria bacterium]